MTATDESTAMADAIRAQLALAIEPQEFDGPEFRKDPFPLYKRLRDHHPIYQDLFHNNWVASRYDDIVAIFQNNDDFDRASYDPKGDYEFGKKHVFGPNILEYGNSDEHRFLRNVVADQFVGNRLSAFLPFIEQIARELMGQIWAKSADDIAKGFSDTGEVELVSQFTNQFPIRVISNMLGLPREDEDMFVRWYQHLIEGLGFGGEHFAKGHAGAERDVGVPGPADPARRRRARRGPDLAHRARGVPRAAHERGRDQGVSSRCCWRRAATRPTRRSRTCGTTCSTRVRTSSRK